MGLRSDDAHQGSPNQGRAPRVARIALAVYVVAGGILVLGPLPLHLFDIVVNVVQAVASVAGNQQHVNPHTVEKVSNALLFLPVAALALIGFSRLTVRAVVLLCFAASALIEIGQ